MGEGEIELGAGRLAVWPADQEILALDEQRTVLRTRFHDSDHYHPGLTAKILELAAKPDLAAQRAKSMGGTKLYGLHEWDSPEADLIEARAIAFFKRALGQEEAAVDVSWNLNRDPQEGSMLVTMRGQTPVATA